MMKAWWYLFVGVIVPVLTVWSGAKAAPCSTDDGLAEPVEFDGLRAIVKFNPGVSATARSEGVAQQLEDGTLVLKATHGLEWTISVAAGEDGIRECSVSFSTRFANDNSPLPVRGFVGNTLPDSTLTGAAPDLSEPSFFVRLSAPGNRRYGACGTELPPDRALPESLRMAVGDLDVQVKLGKSCITLLQLRRDPRKVIIDQGMFHQEAYGSAPPEDPLVIVRDADKPTCQLDVGSGPPVPIECTTVLTIPNGDSLPSATVPVSFVSLRAVPLFESYCPHEMPPLASVPVTRNADGTGAVKLCAYREGVDHRDSPTLAVALGPLGALKARTCAGDVNCTSPQALDGTLLLAPAAEVVRLKLEKNGGTVLNLSLNELKDAPKISPTNRERTLFAKVSDTAKVLRDAICVGIKVENGRPSDVNTKKLVVKINGDEIKNDGWIVRTQEGTELCPENPALDLADLDAQALALQGGQDVVVKHVLDGVTFSTTTLRSDKSLPVRAISVHLEGQPGKIGQKVDVFAATKMPPVLGDWLCLEMPKKMTERSAMWIELGRISVLNAYGRKIGEFTAGSETSLKFRGFDGAHTEDYKGDGWLYCASLSAPGGNGLQFSPTSGGSTEQAMIFAWDASSEGCRDEGDKSGVECGQLEPRWIYSAVAPQALRFSHIEVGAWQITDDTSRVRISAMLPLLVAGVGYPGIVSTSFEAGLAVPASLSSSANERPVEETSASNDEQDPFAGIGVGGYGAACVKLHVELAPRICAGGMADVGVDLIQKENGSTSAAFAPLAGYFFSVGAGIR